jgi:hypothetical protein
MLRFVLSVFLFFSTIAPILNSLALTEMITCSGMVPMKYRNDKISITDFGGVGDGRTLNTKAFQEAIYRIQHLRRRGGTLLYIPPGVYLTESFNLTSHMTLYLARGAVIKATQVLIISLIILHLNLINMALIMILKLQILLHYCLALLKI